MIHPEAKPNHTETDVGREGTVSVRKAETCAQTKSRSSAFWAVFGLEGALCRSFVAVVWQGLTTGVNRDGTCSATLILTPILTPTLTLTYLEPKPKPKRTQYCNPKPRRD